MRTEPDKHEVLAWLLADRSRTSRMAAKRFWPHVIDQDELRTLQSRIRKWSQVNRQSGRDVRLPEPSRPTPPAVSPSDDRIGWLRGQLDQLASDIEYARGKHDWTAVNQLTGRATALALELDEVVRAPPPESTAEPARPIFSNAAVAAMSPAQLAWAIRALASRGRLSDDEIAATLADAELAARAIEARAARMVQDALDLEAEIDLEVGDAPLGSGTEVVQADIAAPLSGPAVRVSPFVRPGKKR